MRHLVATLVFLVALPACVFDRTFFPTDRQTPVAAGQIGREFSFLSRDGAEIHGFYLETGATPKATIYLFHGSGENTLGWQERAEPLVAARYDVIMMDYRGFGHSEGKPTHSNAVSDAREMVRFVEGQVRSSKKILMGQSYGGQLAIHLAHDFPNDFSGLIVEGTFTSHRDEVIASVPYWFKPIVAMITVSPYKAKELIKEITVPILIIHSADDQIVPFRMGQTLFENATGPAEFWEIRGPHAAGLLEMPERYVAKVDEFVMTGLTPHTN